MRAYFKSNSPQMTEKTLLPLNLNLRLLISEACYYFPFGCLSVNCHVVLVQVIKETDHNLYCQVLILGRWLEILAEDQSVGREYV